MKQHNTVLPHQRGPKPVSSRQAIETQIRQLKEAIKTNLIRAGVSAQSNKLDNAIHRHNYVVHQLATLKALTTKAGELSKLSSVPDKTDQPRKASTTTLVKRKSYNRWSKK